MPRTPLRHTPLAARLAVALAVAGASLTASTSIHAESSHQPTITAARADGAFLRIDGIELGAATPGVTLGGTSLTVVSTAATRVEVLLPIGLAPGSYLLTFTASKGSRDEGSDASRYDEFWVTIGAAGPQGSVGPQGPAGSQGPAGKDGANGAPGLTGANGAPGVAGAQGATGAPGAPGVPGASGNPGAVGPAGPAGRDGATGPAGPAGATGPAGPAGTPGTLTSFVVTNTVNYAGLAYVDAEASCPPGSVITGGSSYGYAFDIFSQGPGRNGWYALGTAHLFADATAYVEATAVCLRFN